MEDTPCCSTILDGEVVGIRFSLANGQEICIASISDCAITHASQLSNPFLGLPLEFGKCESCGTSEPGKCEGHFGYIDLPIPIYHPNHITELRKMLSLICLKCLKMKKNKSPSKNIGFAERLLSSCCEDASQVSIREARKADGASYLQLKVSSRSRLQDGFWDFLERYGFHYGDGFTRTLLPCEVKEILKKIPSETRKKLAGKGYFPQDGYILQYLPVPPNCLSVPEISDGVTIMSSDPSISMLKKILRQVEIIKGSRSGAPNFESHEVEANDLQLAIDQYLQVRGTVKAPRGVDARYGVNKDFNDPSTKAWLEKMRTLFIRKGSGFSSRSVITGDSYKLVNEIGVPFEIAQRITFEERVNMHNIRYLQDLVDRKLCLTFRDGSSSYSLREGSMGHTYLKPGQIVHRRIMDGDIVFINRPPTTHKHSLQALRVYLHDDHTVKINPLICGPLSADFDGDCIHLFYPQSLDAKAEVLGLFSVEKQLLSSHSGNLNLQLTTDSLLSLKMMFRTYFLGRAAAEQLAMFVSSSLPPPALLRAQSDNPHWTVLQILQTVLPASFDCHGENYLIKNSDFLKFDFNRDVIPSLINEIVTSIFFQKGPEEVLSFFNSLQPLLMEHLFAEGFSVSLDDYSMPKGFVQALQKNFQLVSPLLYQLRLNFNELVELQLENHIRSVKVPFTNFILKLSSLGKLFDSKSDSAINKVVQQIGFLGLQLSDKRRFYSKTLIEDVASLFHNRYSYVKVGYPSAEFGLIKGCFFHGLDPYEEMVHSISTREVMVRSSRGLTEPGTLFKNLMAILRDVAICYDGTVRNVCSNSIIQFEYGIKAGMKSDNLFPPGEPVGVLAATAMSNPAYKAVLDSTPSSNSSWELMKEILLCKVSFKNEPIDRRVILYLNDCHCGRKYCNENAAYLVKSHLKKVTLKDVTVDFMIEYNRQQIVSASSGVGSGLVGHVHLNKMLLKEWKINMNEVSQRCEDTVTSFRKMKKKVGQVLKGMTISFSEHCSFHQSCEERTEMPCLFFWQDASFGHLERTAQIFADLFFPVLSKTIIKGDPRISAANIIWISPDSTSWQRNPCREQNGELALDIHVEKSVVKQNGDAWRNVLDCCLPVIHLIDTRRSIPYAIKQVQELLGISCTFDQTVERLAKSVKMVAKGVLEDHLILLANNMTCSGNMIGFNSGGYKALSRALNIQVPFTEATLFTPRKCFETAATKCHTDSLSSIVASCSWGKHVAVGTGSRFDIIWDKKELDCDQDDVLDVYNFLNMVRSDKLEESTTGCIGVEIDNLMQEDEYRELSPSPEPLSTCGKPVFEDIVDFQNCLDNCHTESKWENDSNASKSQDKTSNSDGWGTSVGWGKSNGLSGLEKDKAESETHDALDNRVEETSKSSGWEDKGWSGGTSKTEGIWANHVKDKAESCQVKFTKIQEEASKTNGWNTADGWGKNAGDVDQCRNDDLAQIDLENGSCVWNSKANHRQENHQTSSWANSTDLKKDNFSFQDVKHNDSFAVEKSREASQGWDSQEMEQSWGKQKSSQGWDTQEMEQSRGKQKSSQGWDSQEVEQSWGKQKSGKIVQSWGSQNESNRLEGSKSLGTKVGDSQEIEQSWGKQKSSQGLDSQEIEQSWGKQKSGEVVQSWGSQNESNSLEGSKSWGKKVGDSQEIGQSWGKQKSSQGWDSQETEQSWGKQKSSQGWDSQETEQSWGKQKSGEVVQSWGSQNESNRLEGPKSWGTNADWKNRKNRPPKSPGVMNNDAGMHGLYTATGQRLDMFTAEEQDILTDIEPIMQSIRKIMNGYNDGDPLSAEDQSYILQNVFNFHPDKAVKMGSGIDHFMVSRHSSFQESRCLYVVSTDGHKEDFSYRKCLDNFVKGKYPDLAELFVPKYFRKPRSGRNQERNSASEENERKNDGGELNPIPEETGNVNEQ